MRLDARGCTLLLTVLILIRAPSPAHAQASILAARDRASMSYPDRITFSVRLQSEAEIEKVVLEYGTQDLTCEPGSRVKKLTFTPAKTVEVSWTWEIPLWDAPPPGAQIYWRWQVTDSSGGTLTTETQTVTWLDNQHAWQMLHDDQVNLYWYSGNRSFAEELSTSAMRVIHNLAQDIGLEFDQPISILVYASDTDFLDAVPQLPDWAGGVAFTEYSVILFVAAPDEVTLGQLTEAHEITHVLIRHFTFNCQESVQVPPWLSEGLAVYNEGWRYHGPDDPLEAAIANNTLISVRSLNRAFPTQASKVDLAYQESYSLVSFLIEDFGREKILALFEKLRDGASGEEALKAVYGFDLDGLEDAWRAKIGARGRYITATPTVTSTATPTATSTSSPTPTPTATPTPTITPSPTATATCTATPTLTSTASPTTTATPTPTPRPALISTPGLAAIVGGAICLVLLGAAGVVLFAIRKGCERMAAAGLRVVLILAIFAPISPGLAQAPIAATQDQAEIQFPESITFSIELESEAEIEQVSLEYRVEQVTCGEVVARAFPQFTPGKAVSATWTWEMRQSGSLPPGARIHWLWHVSDAAGHTLTTAEQSITWLDSTHAWQTLNGDKVDLHWYDGPDTFAQELLDAADAALADLELSTGLKPEKMIDLYIFASTDDLRQAILYEPGWTGGQAFPEHDIVIIGISPGQIEWGKGAIAHELTHVLVGHLTFSCLGFVPGWLVEGLAMYGEGGPDDFSQASFKQAVTDDTLVSVQALSGGFSENPDKANIAYSESYSLVNFLIEAYGKDSMLALLQSLKEGATVDGALQAVYGFDINGLEDAWREDIGAQARQAPAEEARATATPTLVPTIEPVSAAGAGPTAAPTRLRTTAAPVSPTPASPAATSIAANTPTATRSPVPAVRASPTPKLSTPAGRPASTQAPEPEKTSPAWYSGAIRIITSGGAACLILGVVAVAFFFAVLRPQRRRRKL
jgi:hypothetical protein